VCRSADADVGRLMACAVSRRGWDEKELQKKGYVLFGKLLPKTFDKNGGVAVVVQQASVLQFHHRGESSHDSAEIVVQWDSRANAKFYKIASFYGDNKRRCM
jgi:hypothetical protein